MQQSTQPNLPQLTCPKLNKARMLCVSAKCTENALICFQQSCEICEKSHQHCEYYRLNSLLEQITAKRQKITPEIQHAMKTMEKVYDEAIQRLSEDKEQIRNQAEMFGFSQHQAKFMMMINDGIAYQIKGKLTAQIVSNISIQNEWLATEESILKFWNRRKKQFHQIFDKFKKVTTKKYAKLESHLTDEIELLEEWLQKPVAQFKLLYRASEHNYSAAKFHANCDGKSDTIVIAKTQFGKTIGGYTPCAWRNSGSYVNDTARKTFLFSITNREKYAMVHPQYAITANPNYGPTFGGGHDFYIADNCKTAANTSYFNFGHSFNLNAKYTNGSPQAYEAFSGSTSGNYYSTVDDYEVFEIEWQ